MMPEYLHSLCKNPSVFPFAVALPLIKRADEWYLLYEVRAASLRRQGGEVCFPGGKAEDGEDAAVCAQRELKEELGLSPLEIYGALPFSMLSRGGEVCPVLMQLPDQAPQPNPAEVADTFTVPLSYLIAHPPRYYPREGFPGELVGIAADYHWWSAYDTIPVYEGLPYPLWGLTARMTHQFLKLLTV